MMKSLEGSLKRLQTDHVDVYFNHAVNDVDRMKNPEWPSSPNSRRSRARSASAACPATAAT